LRLTDEQVELLRAAYEGGDDAEPNRMTVRLLIAEVQETRVLLAEFKVLPVAQMAMPLDTEDIG
jgi:hypothetical protein